MGVHLMSVRLIDMHLIRVDLVGVYLIGMHLMGVHLKGVHLIGMYIMGLHLIGVPLMAMHHTGMHLMGVHLISMYHKVQYRRPLPGIKRRHLGRDLLLAADRAARDLVETLQEAQDEVRDGVVRLIDQMHDNRWWQQ